MKTLKFAIAAFMLLFISGIATAQATLGYGQIDLSCRSQCSAPNHSDFLNAPWGITFLPGQNFLIAEHDSGRVDSYDASGALASGFSVPLPAGSTATVAHPTGIVAVLATNFVVGTTRLEFFVATEEGTIVGFNINNGVFQDAHTVVDRSTSAEFTGMTLLHPACCTNALAAANFHDGQIEVFSLSPTALPGAFEDPNLPAGYAPYNIQTVGNQVFVTYAKKDQTGRAPLLGPGLGIVSIFDQEGNFVRRFASEGALSNGGSLSAPWGVTATSPNFGPFPNKILINNTGSDRRILIFDPVSAEFLGTLVNSEGGIIGGPGTRALTFRGDRNSDGVGDPDSLYFVGATPTGGVSDGLFAAIQVGELTTIQLTAQDAVIGTETTLSAEVHPVAGSDTATGTVVFHDLSDANNTIGSATLSGGIVTLQHTYTTTGAHLVFAEYQGTGTLLKSLDAKQVNVLGPATTTTLTGPAAAGPGTPVIFRARTLSPDAIVTGNITFQEGSAVLGVVPLDEHDTASLTITTLARGTHQVTASYSGPDFQSSTSAPVTVVIGGDFQFTSNAPSVSIPAGNSADVMLTINPVDGFVGPVTFTCLAPSGLACSFDPSTLNVNGNAVTTKLTVATRSMSMRTSHGFGFAFVSIGVFGTLLIGHRTGGKKAIVSLIALMAIGGSLVACGGSGSQSSGGNHNPPTFTVTLNAASGSIVHSTSLTVTVQ